MARVQPAMVRGRPAQALTIADKRELAKRTLLTDEIRTSIVKNVSVGMFERQACDFAGVHYAVYQQWKQWSVSGLEPYTAFFREIQTAQRERVTWALEQIHNLSKEWKAAAWWLDRVYPYWREGNVTDDPPPQVGSVEDVVREVLRAFPPDQAAEIAKGIASSLIAIKADLPPADPVMGLLPSGGVAHDETEDTVLEGDGGSVNDVSGAAVAADRD